MVRIRATASDDGGLATLSLWLNGAEIASGTDGSLTHALDTTALDDGPCTIEARALDLAGNLGQAEVVGVVDNTPPELEFSAPAPGARVEGAVTVTVRATDEHGVLDVALAVDGAAIGRADVAPYTFSLDTMTLTDGGHRLEAVGRDPAGNEGLAERMITVDNSGELPPDPVEVAPTLSGQEGTDFVDGIAFLYTGDDPIQTGVAEGAIAPARAAVLRGRVLDEAGEPLPLAAVRVLGHPELGQTKSRADGAYDLAVNGGGPVSLTFTLAGRLSAQRRVVAPWRGFAAVPDVALIRLDEASTVVNLAGSGEVQVARGTETLDLDGPRQATLLFPAGTEAVMEMPDGSTQPLTSATVRATEITVGENGPAQMPGVLPPTSGYTYAVELTADEALAAGAAHVRFDRKLPFYLENFISAPVGTAVPTGWFDRTTGMWVPSENGRVIEVVGRADGVAQLDVDGSGGASPPGELAALGITEDERRRVADLYADGTQLWRVPIEHFTPWDPNWPEGPPETADPPNQPPPDAPPPPEPDPCDKYKSSVIECQNQALTEDLPIVGTGHRLSYRSTHADGYAHDNSLQVWLTGPTLNPLVKRVELSVLVQGQHLHSLHPAQTNLSHTVTWNGRDAYGRKVIGSALASVQIAYVYDSVFYPTPIALARAFARVRGRGIDPLAVGFAPRQTQREVLVIQRYQATLHGFYPEGVGNWRLADHHRYDFDRGVVHRGSGAPRGATGVISAPTIRAVAGTGERGFGGDGGLAVEAQLRNPYGLAIHPDGSLYIADSDNHRVRRVTDDGIIETIAGTGEMGFSGDGGPAADAQLNYPAALSFMPDGSLLIADAENRRIRKISVDGVITTVAGQTEHDVFDDGLPAVDVLLAWPYGVAADPSGGFYVLETFDNARIRHVGEDGVIDTVVGTGERGFSGDGGPARIAQIGSSVERVAVGPDGALFFSDTRNDRVRRVGIDGTITTVAGGGNPAEGNGDGGLATEAELESPLGLTVGPDGTLYIAEIGTHSVRRVAPDGVITTIAGTGRIGMADDAEPAKRSLLRRPNDPVLTPDGDLYVVEIGNHRVVRITPTLPRRSVTDLYVPSVDGAELYQFAPTGRHLATLEPLTGAVIRSFEYTSAGVLTAVRARGDRVTTIERDGAGTPTAIVGPYGHRTALEHDGEGDLTRVVAPDGSFVRLEYDAGGLLTGKVDSRGLRYTYDYDDSGALTRFTDPAGGDTSLVSSSVPLGRAVTRTTVEGRATEYRIERDLDHTTRLVNTFPSGHHHQVLRRPDATERVTFADGTVVEVVYGPDPRFGLAAPVLQSRVVSTPGARALRQSVDIEATYTDPGDPLSLASITKTIVVNGKTTVATFDAGSRQLVTTSPEGRTRTATLDPQGRLTRFEVPGLAPQVIAYDAQGRLSTLTEGEGAARRVLTARFGADGLVDQIAGPGARTEAFVYDGLGRLTGWTDPASETTTYGYDPNGNILAITLPHGRVHAFTYSPVNLRTSYRAPEVGGDSTSRYGYDRDRAQTSYSEPGPRALTLTHDEGGRLSTVSTPRGTTTYAYDPATARLVSVQASDGNSVALGWDGSLPVLEAWSGEVSGSVGWTYDDDLRRQGQLLNGGASVGFAYDDDGRLTQAGALTIQRDAGHGLVTGTSLGGVTTGRNYDDFGDLATIEAVHGGATLFADAYHTDEQGRLTRRQELSDGASRIYAYRYDAVGRLTEVTRDGARHEAYAYDPNGNRTQAEGPTLPPAGASFDLQDRMQTQGPVSFGYLPSGHLRTRTEGPAVTTYDYDVDGNLRSATLADGRVITYVVGPLNRRLGRRIDGALVQGLLYDGRTRLVAELDGAGQVVSRFVYGTRANVPDYMVRGGVTYRIVSDRVGSPRLVVNAATGAVAQRLDYDAFGNVLTDTQPGFTPFGFAGGLYDPDTKLVRFGARDYMPEIGRFTAKDPIGFSGDPGNLYAYAGNDPVSFVDPAGLSKGRPWLYEDCERWFEQAMEEAECLDHPLLEQVAKDEYEDCNWILDNWWWLGTKEGESPEEPYREWWRRNWEDNDELDFILDALPEDQREGVSRAWRRNLLQSSRNNGLDEHVRDSIDGRWRHNSKDW